VQEASKQNRKERESTMLRPLMHTPYLPAKLRFGLLLNGNARRVTQRLVDRLRAHVPMGDLYYTRSLEEAATAMRDIYRKEYDVLLVGGGDGSFLQAMTALQKIQASDPIPRRLPAYGVLPLGTGNAVASVIGADPKLIPTLERLQRRDHDIPLRFHHWVEVEGTQAPFAGLGFDSLALNTYKSLLASLKDTPFQFLGKGFLGYMNAIFLLSLPRFLMQKPAEIEVYNEDDYAALLGADGKPVREFGKGELMFRGRPIMTAASTVSCYGFHFQNFPFARDGQRMQLRIADLPVRDVLLNLPAVWRGEYRHPQLHDFAVQRIRIACERPMPLQIGGDAVGEREEIIMARSARPTLMADLAHSKRPLLAPATQIR
jgi:diacylglycerol kinase family enzyme